MFNFYNPWKRQKTYGFLMFSGGIEMEHWIKTYQYQDPIYKCINIKIRYTSIFHKPFFDIWQNFQGIF